MTSLANDAVFLKEQLSVARNEIQNLRKQIMSLTFAHQTDVKNIKELLNGFQCQSCKVQSIGQPAAAVVPSASTSVLCHSKSDVLFKPIGVIRTEFPEKRAVPRQPTVCPKLQGCIQLNRDVFNNPEHSLDGLHEFSHLWIIYHFHRNDAHTKAKVAPPRLGGDRVGIFSTRSPHRPCPIGLSLVEIDRIDGAHIFFFGTDMVDQTPVLDIKPYIPRYDSPMHDAEMEYFTTVQPDDNYGSREEPDGEETEVTNGAMAMSNVPSPQTNTNTSLPRRSGSRPNLQMYNVRVPNWVASDSTLSVAFNERAEQQLNELPVNKTSIVEILENDPRSVYLRTRYGSQIFTFQLGEVTVTCKFDDANSLVTVLQVRLSENLSNESN